jgi:hypothetical protein
MLWLCNIYLSITYILSEVYIVKILALSDLDLAIVHCTQYISNG